jgi:hypothetical protein
MPSSFLRGEHAICGERRGLLVTIRSKVVTIFAQTYCIAGNKTDAATFREEQKMARGTALIIFITTLLPMSALAKDTRFWNLTANTITSVQLSPTGKNDWGRNQADNDRDRTVDHDERLKITDTPPGMYDVKFVDKSGRTCIVSNIDIKEGLVFSIEEKNLKNCVK